MRIVLLLLIALVVGGCFEDQAAPPAFASQNKGVAADDGAAGLPACAVEPVQVPTEHEALRAMLDGDPNDDNDGAVGEFTRAQRWNTKADERLKDLLARYLPALTEAQQKSFVDAYETLGDATYDGNDRPVKEVREEYFKKTSALAGALTGVAQSAGAIDAMSKGSPAWARMAFETGWYSLSTSPCPARAVQFAGQMLTARAQGNPLAPLYADDREPDVALWILQEGLAQAIVERTIVHQDVEKGIADVRSYLEAAKPFVEELDGWESYANVLAALASKDALVAFATTGEPKVEFNYEGDATVANQLRIAAGFAALVGASPDVDVNKLAGYGKQGLSALSQGMERGAKFFGWARLTTFAARFKSGATWFNRVLTVALELPAVAGSLDSLVNDPDGDKRAYAAELVGHILVIAGAFLPMPWGIAVGFAGKLAIMIAKSLKAPDNEDLPAIFAQVGFDAIQSEAIIRSSPDKLKVMRNRLGLEPPDVVWLQTRSLHVYDPNQLESLAHIAEKKNVRGAALMKWLKGIVASESVQWDAFTLTKALEEIQFAWFSRYKFDSMACNTLRNAATNVMVQRTGPMYYAEYFMLPYADLGILNASQSEQDAFTDRELRPRAQAALQRMFATFPGGCS